MPDKPWYASWFDTPWYPILYKNRSESEASAFISRLLEHLSLSAGASVLDLACGRGRHSLQLARAGFQVTGLDLSESSIASAKESAKRESIDVDFEVHDMREPFRTNSFDAILNMFTSFGYFDSDADNKAVLAAVCQGLKADGVFVLDFMNARNVVERLVPEETREEDGLEFHIKRWFDGKHIIKQIQFEVQGRHMSFQEKVQGLMPDDFDSLFEGACLQIRERFGDYHLQPFDPEQSERLILVAGKSDKA